jgi:hypothetical protein
LRRLKAAAPPVGRRAGFARSRKVGEYEGKAMAIERFEKVLYRTSDGKEFDDEKEAKIHESTLDLTSFLDSSDIYWRKDVDPEEVAKLILAHFVVLRRKGTPDA